MRSVCVPHRTPQAVSSPLPLLFLLPFLVSRCSAHQQPPLPQLCTMTNWHDPAVIKAQHGLFVFWPWSGLLMQVLCCSFSCQIYLCLGWHLHVGYIHMTFVMTYHFPAGRFYPTSAMSTLSLWESTSSLGLFWCVCSLPFNLNHRIRRSTGHLQIYLGCRWCPLFSIMSQCLGFDWPHKIDCQVWTSLGCRVIQVRKLTC